MVLLVNYADETYSNAQKYNTKTAKEIGKVDVVKEFGPQSIDEAFLMRNADSFVVGDSQKGKHGLWRPLILKSSYEELEKGDFLMYADSGTYFVNDVHFLTDFMDAKNLNILVFELPFVEKYWTKRDVFVVLDCDSEEFTETNQRLSTAFIIRKSSEGQKFIDEYVKVAMNNPELFTDEENKKGKPNYEGFVQNRHNQSVLSLISKKMGVKAYRDITEYGNRLKLYSYYELPKYTFNYKTYDDSTYPQILIQHRRGVVSKKVEILGKIRSKGPGLVNRILIMMSILKQKIR